MTEIITEESFVDSSRFGIQKGVDAVIAVCKRALGHYDGMLHAISNVLIEVDGDSAVARYYGHSHAMRRGVEGGDTVTNIGEAMMEFVRTPQGWRVLQYKSRLKWHEGNPKVRVNQADPATHQVGS